MSLFWKAAAAVLLAGVLGLSLGKQKDIWERSSAFC